MANMIPQDEYVLNKKKLFDNSIETYTPISENNFLEALWGITRPAGDVDADIGDNMYTTDDKMIDFLNPELKRMVKSFNEAINLYNDTAKENIYRRQALRRRIVEAGTNFIELESLLAQIS